ncbi:hypothetical protein [uncultured Maribacter sp.]|uniref:hypothetical protein n=1 Tax=uncultured Maribacter sp. TaxID=431308 RepID=UPI00261AC610|nr:hypothetical protein [uncultured Maribacter sp.]
MKLKIELILVFSLFFIHCKEGPKKKYTTETKVKNSSAIIEKSKLKIKKISIPSFGEIEVNQNQIDSTHIFNAGDCGGNITRYKIDKKFVTIDTTSCGDYGDTYTCYVLDSINSIELVFEEKYTFIKNGKIINQLLIDFNEEPVIAKKRTDTVYSNKEKHLNLFQGDTLVDVLKSFENWSLNYENIWKYKNSDE